MAGLVAAARARELKAEPVLYEKGTRAGGSMLLSSGFIWRYRSLEIHLEECPGADEQLARTLVEQFDEALDWLESLGVELLTRGKSSRCSRATSVSAQRPATLRSWRPEASLRGLRERKAFCFERTRGARATA